MQSPEAMYCKPSSSKESSLLRREASTGEAQEHDNMFWEDGTFSEEDFLGASLYGAQSVPASLWDDDSDGFGSFDVREKRARCDNPLPCMARELEQTIWQHEQEHHLAESDRTYSLACSISSSDLAATFSADVSNPLPAADAYAVQPWLSFSSLASSAQAFEIQKRVREISRPVVAPTAPFNVALKNALKVNKGLATQHCVWKGCVKSGWCNRENRHRGLCNNKATVQGLSAYSKDDLTQEELEDAATVQSQLPRSQLSHLELPLQDEQVAHESDEGSAAYTEFAERRIEPAGQEAIADHESMALELIQMGEEDDNGAGSESESEDEDEGLRKREHSSGSDCYNHEARKWDNNAETEDTIYSRDDATEYEDDGVDSGAAMGTSSDIHNNFRLSPPGSPSKSASSLQERRVAPVSSRMASVDSTPHDALGKVTSPSAKRGPGRPPKAGAISDASRGKKRAAGGVIKSPAAAPNGQQCTQCSTQVTPVWRAGPMGPKTLCNACGVRYMKSGKRK